MTTAARKASPDQSEELRLQALGPELTLVLTRVRLRARLRTDWLRKLWAEEGDTGVRLAVTHAEADAVIEDRDSPEAEASWLASERQLRQLKDQLASVEKKLLKARRSRLAQFEQIFGLGPEESDLFQVCLAQALDPSLGRLYAYLQDHSGRSYVTEEMAARLFGYGRCGPWSAESALFRWELISRKEVAPGEPQMLVCDPQVRDWFLGRNDLDRMLIGVARLHQPIEPFESWPVDEAAAFLKRAINSEAAERVRLTISGPPRSGRKSMTATVASRLGLPLLVIDADTIDDQDWRRVFLRAQRQAYLDRCALAWRGESLLRRVWPQLTPLFPIQFVITEPGQILPPVHQVLEQTIAIPALTVGERMDLWQRYLPASESWTPKQLGALASRYRATVGDIASVARKGVSSVDEAAQAVREAARGRLDNLAQLLECPFEWDDLVVPPHVRDTLEDLVFESSTRASFWEKPQARRLFPQGRGLLALFSGSPGTGKTMATQIVAAQLGMDLYRIDLSALISKWVGETSQNIERLLRRAASMDIVLLFDEADAIFSRRTTEVRDAQDRFANMDTSHLMVAIENYPGIVMLATNLKGNIDAAFLRRIRYVVDFPRPDASQRLKIWRKVIGGLVNAEAVATLGADIERLATDVEATGSQIKYGVLGALFVAERACEPLSISHLLRGLNRELAKEGRSLSDRELERFLKNGR